MLKARQSADRDTSIGAAWSSGAVAAPFLLRRACAAEAVRAYSIWPENYARPMLEAFEKATGIHVNFVRFSSGEALARLIAEKGNPQVDVLFGGPVETFTAGEDQGIFDAYSPPSAADLPQRFKSAKGHVDRDRRRSAGVHDQHQIPRRSTILKPPASWDDLLDPAYKGQLQMADARTSGTAVTRIFSILQVNNRNEDAAFALHEEAPPATFSPTPRAVAAARCRSVSARPRAASSSSSMRCSRGRRATTCRFPSRRKASVRRPNASRWSRATRTPPRQRS